MFGVELRFKDPMAAIPMAREVRKRLDGPYRVVDWQELNHNLFTALKMQKVMISLLLVIIILVAAFNIIASLTMIVMSKVREIAILKSMGAPAATLARVFLVAGTSVGAVGTLLGTASGLMVCGLARLYGYPLDPKVYLIGKLPVEILPRELVAVAAATLAICILSTLYPSVRASAPACRRRVATHLAAGAFARHRSGPQRRGSAPALQSRPSPRAFRSRRRPAAASGCRRLALGLVGVVLRRALGHDAVGRHAQDIVGAERTLGDDLGVGLERVGDQAGVVGADDRGRARRAALES